MPKPEEYKQEEAKVRRLLTQALGNIEEASASDLWSYTREYWLGKLMAARESLADVVKHLRAGERVRWT